MHHTSLLNKIYLLFFPLFLFSFDNLYNLNDDFEVVTTKDNYRLILKEQKFINYQITKGFKFFIPYFTTEFNLKVLRYNSIGYINGKLSMDKKFGRVMKKIYPTQLKYYMTDYKSNGRELNYLLNNRSVPYTKVTSLSIEAYNIPFSVSKRLNRYIYFKIDKLPKNKLEYVLYSFYLVLDRNLVDKYTKSYFPHSKNLIDTFLKNYYQIKPYMKKKKVVKKNKKKEPLLVFKNSDVATIDKKNNKTKKVVIRKKVEKKHTVTFRLNLKRFLYLKEYGYLYIKNDLNTQKMENKSNEIVDELQDISSFLFKKLNSKILFSPIKIYQDISAKFDKIGEEITNLPLLIETNKCNFKKDEIDKKCFKNPIYFQDYIYFSIKNNKLPENQDTIFAYGDYRTFNDIGKYYFENGNFKKAEIYFKKAYILAKNKTIPAHNLAVLYSTSGINEYNAEKTIKYLKESNLVIDYYNLGVYYYLGLGVKESDKMARTYFEKSKEIPYAKENLEIMNKYKIGLK